jgi:hypothetical protein
VRIEQLAVGVLALAALAGLTLFESELLNSKRTFSPQDLAGSEAKGWLKQNKNESALASNRFGYTKEAIKFVDALYAAGAPLVIVPKSSITDDPDTLEIEGGPYADALIVKLPTDAGPRQKVEAICARELDKEGSSLGDASSDEYVFLWWD